MMNSQRDTAQICSNGHVANDSFTLLPQFNKDYCEKCGEKTLTHCQSCQKPIAGRLIDSGGFGRFNPPAYCRYCGNPFPWTARALEAAREMADELDSLSGDEKEKLKATFNDLTSDTARTPLAVSRFRKFMDKIGRGTCKIRRVRMPHGFGRCDYRGSGVNLRVLMGDRHR